MGLVLNPRGAGGAGKTELVRRIMVSYRDAEAVHRPGRSRPILYRLGHPAGGRKLVVLGHYERRSGGCDTVTLRDGGMAEVFRLAAQSAARGHDVLLEGLRLSEDHAFSAALAARHDLHVLRLTTPPETCARNLLARRRAGAAARPAYADAASLQHRRIAEACARLEGRARVEHLGFDAALRRARALLALPFSEG